MAYRIIKGVAAAYALAAAGLTGGAAVGYDAYDDYQHASETSAIIREDIKGMLSITHYILVKNPPRVYEAAPNFMHGMYVTPAYDALAKPEADIVKNCTALRGLYTIAEYALKETPDKRQHDLIALPVPSYKICRIAAP